MTLRQTIHAAPAKANDLIAKLSATSNQAIKAREGLFADLSTELTLYVDLEEQHLIPLLRKHAETKGLASDVHNGSKALRSHLAELAALPKDGDAFLVKLSELQSGLQQHIRDERKELLPAVLKALSDEEASDLAARIEGGVADAEAAKREAAKQARLEARREAEAAEQAAEAQRALARAQKAAAREARAAADDAATVVERGVSAAQSGARQLVTSLTDRSERSLSAVRDTMTVYRSSAESASQDLRAVGASASIVSKSVSEIGSVWMSWIGEAARVNSEASKKLLQCRSIGDIADVQRDYLSSSMRNLIESSTKVLELAQRASKQAARPLDDRLTQN